MEITMSLRSEFKKRKKERKIAEAAAAAAARAATRPSVPLVNGIPHYTRMTVIDLFKANDPRIRTNEFGTLKALMLSDEPGFFKYSEDEKGEGYATFYVGDYANAVPVFSAAAEITDEIRNRKCTGCDNCGAKWYDLISDCSCSNHHEDEHYDVLPRFELCTCPGDDINDRHVHLYGFCQECFYIDTMMNDKEPKDASAGGFAMLVQDGPGDRTEFHRWDEAEPQQTNLITMPLASSAVN
jgi:hypothetical protein